MPTGTAATGVLKEVRYKKEATWNVAPGATAAQKLRRVTSTLNLQKDIFKSNEMRPELQVTGVRHGIRMTNGKLSGELSPGTYKDFFAASLRRLYVAITAITAASITIAGAGPTYTLTRAAGSFLTDGIKVGHVIRLSVGTFNAANINKNLVVVSLTATILTVIVLNGVALVAEGPITSSTVTVIGKTTFTPTTGHTDDSFWFEHWFSDIAQSEQFGGCQIDTVAVACPPDGLATIDMGVKGAGITTAQAAYFTTPTAATTTGLTAGVNGAILVNGVVQALVTGFNFTINGSYDPAKVIGNATIADLFPDMVDVSGQITAYFVDRTLPDLFINEQPASLVVVLSVDNTATSDFLCFAIPLAILTSADADDQRKGVLRTYSFQAEYNALGGVGTSTEQTTLMVQDSAA